MAEKKKTFINRFIVTHDGKRYKPGSEIQAFEHEVEDLVKRGTLYLKGKEKGAVSPGSGMPDAVIGEPKPPEGAAKQITDDPGSPVPGNTEDQDPDSTPPDSDPGTDDKGTDDDGTGEEGAAQ